MATQVCLYTYVKAQRAEVLQVRGSSLEEVKGPAGRVWAELSWMVDMLLGSQEGFRMIGRR